MNSTVDDQMAGGHNLNEPHFDEEATIAARPVVPLDEVKAEKRSKAGVAVALAIGGGLLVGLLAATLIYRYLGASQVPRGETATVEETAGPAGEQTSNQIPSPAGGAVGFNDSAATSAEDETPSVADAESREGQLNEEPNRAPEVAPRRPAVVRESRPPVDEEDEEAERAIRRAERQEERRERRRAMREARRHERQPDRRADDLTRIREIFEGAPKP